MNLKDKTLSILKKHGLWAKKRLGQNFLVSESTLNRIVEAADIKENETALEIGPGTGNLSKKLAEKTKNLILIEKDRDFEEILKPFNTIYMNALDFDPRTLKGSYKIVANIPYYITSPLINHFLREQFEHNGHPPTQIILLIQDEVAEKICDPKKTSVLQLNITTFGEVKIITKVNKDLFYPAPKVSSAVIQIDVAPKPKVDVNLTDYFNLIQKAFAQPRKTLKNNLGPIKTSIDLGLRAQALNIEDFEKLTKETR